MLFHWQNNLRKAYLNREILGENEFQRIRRAILTSMWRYRQFSRGNSLGIGW